MLPLMTLINSKLFWYGMAIVIVLATVGGAYAYVGSLNGQITDLTATNVKLEIKASSAIEAYEAEAKERKRVDTVLGTRERSLSKLRGNYDKLKHRINILEAENVDVKVWMDIPLPDALLSELRERGDSGETDTDVPPGGTDATVPRADPDRRN